MTRYMYYYMERLDQGHLHSKLEVPRVQDGNRTLRRWTWTGDFKCREVKTGFYRNRSMQTGSSGTLIGWKSGQTTFVPLWDWMEGAWLWTLSSAVEGELCRKEPFEQLINSYSEHLHMRPWQLHNICVKYSINNIKTVIDTNRSGKRCDTVETTGRR